VFDWEDNDEMQCSDTDGDTCDDCSHNTSELSNPDGGGYDIVFDGVDYDNQNGNNSLCDGGYDFAGTDHLAPISGPYGDTDDDDDGHLDYGVDVLADSYDDDICPQGMIGVGVDYDQDGCQNDIDTESDLDDDDEDVDDDGDGVLDIDEEGQSEWSRANGNCVLSYPPTYQGDTPNDIDGDGCLSGDGTISSTFLGLENAEVNYESWAQHTNVDGACDHSPVTHDDNILNGNIEEIVPSPLKQPSPSISFGISP
jgi:hypothetical protein